MSDASITYHALIAHIELYLKSIHVSWCQAHITHSLGYCISNTLILRAQKSNIQLSHLVNEPHTHIYTYITRVHHTLPRQMGYKT